MPYSFRCPRKTRFAGKVSPLSYSSLSNEGADYGLGIGGTHSSGGGLCALPLGRIYVGRSSAMVHTNIPSRTRIRLWLDRQSALLPNSRSMESAGSILIRCRRRSCASGVDFIDSSHSSSFLRPHGPIGIAFFCVFTFVRLGGFVRSAAFLPSQLESDLDM